MVIERVPSDEIEDIVGTQRDPDSHYGRANSEEEIFYILHSQACLDSGIDLTQCRMSLALSHGLDLEAWEGYEDQPVPLVIRDGWLMPNVS